MLTWKRLEAGSSKLEAWLTGSEIVLSLEPQASCLKRLSALADDSLMLVFQHPVKMQTSAAAQKQRPIGPLNQSFQVF
jgi:hypothetical protein